MAQREYEETRRHANILRIAQHADAPSFDRHLKALAPPEPMPLAASLESPGDVEVMIPEGFRVVRRT